MRFFLGISLYLAIWVAPLFAQQEPNGLNDAERAFYEKLGLSMTEWMMVKKANMPMDKLYELLETGVSISEYFAKPWEKFEITEEKWLKLRRAGYTDDEIQSNKAHLSVSGEWAVVQNLFLPGCHQWKRKQYGKASLMSGTAIASIGLGSLFLYQDIRKQGNPPVSWAVFVLFLLPADMFWSGLDIHLQIQNELNPEAKRFSEQEICPWPRPMIAFTMPISLGKK
jgi:hypothetical protein